MLSEIKMRRYSFAEILASSSYFYQRHFGFLLGVNFIAFFTGAIAVHLSFVGSVACSFAFPMVMLLISQAVGRDVEAIPWQFTTIWRSSLNKLGTVFKAELLMLALCSICFVQGLIAQNLMASLFKEFAIFASNPLLGFIGLLVPIILFQYSAYIIATSKKSSVRALKYSSILVRKSIIDNTATLLLTFGVSLSIRYGYGYLFSPWKEHFFLFYLGDFLCSLANIFSIVVSVISFLNYDCEYKRERELH